MTFTVISFYRYMSVKQPERFRDWLRRQCRQHDILGRILVATEGINGAVCGLDEDIAAFKQVLKEHPSLKGLAFRQQKEAKQTYHKLIVRVRPEIVAFGAPADAAQTAPHLPSKELKAMYDNRDEFVIVDARNEYEAKVGTFKDAVVLPIKTFREFPKVAPRVLAPYKNKKIIMFCTGGVRCEKASAYLKGQGFSDVAQLDGGIISYLNAYPNTYYEGGCFVFDDRCVSQDKSTKNRGACEICHAKTNEMADCHNLDCDRLFVVCASCREKLHHCCSPACRDAPRKRSEKSGPDLRAGTIENYYPKAGVALIRLRKGVRRGSRIMIKGKTTKPFSLVLEDFLNYDGIPRTEAWAGEQITVKVPALCRKNDTVIFPEAHFSSCSTAACD